MMMVMMTTTTFANGDGDDDEDDDGDKGTKDYYVDVAEVMVQTNTSKHGRARPKRRRQVTTQ